MDEMLRMSGIYVIENLVDGKKYVGSTKQMIRRRRYNHFSDLRLGKHASLHLQRAYDKYGEDNFKFNWLEHCSGINSTYLHSKEKHWIDTLEVVNPDKGYNKNNEPGTLSEKMKAEVVERRQAYLKNRKDEFGSVDLSRSYCYSKLAALVKSNCFRSGYIAHGYSIPEEYKSSRSFYGNTKKPINLYKSDTLEFVETLESISLAAEKLKTTKMKISSCLNGRKKSHRGFVFKYKESQQSI